MTRGYRYIETESRHIPKVNGHPCGDVSSCERTAEHTTFILCDGIGHGVKANIAAQLATSRFMELLRRGFSLRKAFIAVALASEQAKRTDMPYCAFTAARVLNDGLATILGYEAPGALYVTPRNATLLNRRHESVSGAIITEANCYLENGEGLILVSDGITQAGLGRGLVNGWTDEGLAKFVDSHLGTGSGGGIAELPGMILEQAITYWGPKRGDDCSVLLAMSRKGTVVTILTGPPRDRSTDGEVVGRFIRNPGIKVVCGGTTARVTAQALGRKLKIEENPASLITPPRLYIDGIDLVTEGAVTLNQLFNILDVDAARFEEMNAVTDLYGLLHGADRINIIMGKAENPAGEQVAFLQKGILSRETIISLLADKLRKMGKLVVIEEV